LASQCWPQFFARVGCLYSRPASLRSLRLASRQRSLQAAPRSASCRVAPFNLGIAPLVRQQGRFKSGAQGRFAPTCCAVQSVRGAAQRQVRRLAPQSRIVSHRATWPASWQATRLWPCAGSALTGRSSGRATAGLTFSVPCRRTPLTFNVRPLESRKLWTFVPPLCRAVRLRGRRTAVPLAAVRRQRSLGLSVARAASAPPVRLGRAQRQQQLHPTLALAWQPLQRHRKVAPLSAVLFAVHSASRSESRTPLCGCAQRTQWKRRKCQAVGVSTKRHRQRLVHNGLTLPSRGRATSGFACCRTPLTSNVRRLHDRRFKSSQLPQLQCNVGRRPIGT